MRLRFPAIRGDAVSVCRPLDDVASMAASRVGINVFGGGVQLHHTEPVDPGRFMAVEILLPELPARILALARCAWCEACEPGAAGPRWAVGAELHWVGWDAMGTQAEIAELLRSTLGAAPQEQGERERGQDQGEGGRRARAAG